MCIRGSQENPNGQKPEVATRPGFGSLVSSQAVTKLSRVEKGRSDIQHGSDLAAFTIRESGSFGTFKSFPGSRCSGSPIVPEMDPSWLGASQFRHQYSPDLLELRFENNGTERVSSTRKFLSAIWCQVLQVEAMKTSSVHQSAQSRCFLF